MTRPTVSTRPIGPDQIEVRTRCPHAGYRIGYQLRADITERVAVCAAIGHHHMMQTCACMKSLWRRYRTPQAPADLDALRDRFNGFWSGVEAQQQARGFAVVHWPTALRQVIGEGAA